jgi:hypothetical protein
MRVHPYGGRAVTLGFAIAMGITIGAVTAGATSARGGADDDCDEVAIHHRHPTTGCTTTTRPHVTTTKPHGTTTTKPRPPTTTTKPRPPTTTTTKPRPPITIPFKPDNVPPSPSSGPPTPTTPAFLAGRSARVGTASGAGPRPGGAAFVPLTPPVLPPSAATPTPGAGSPLNGLTEGPGGVPLSMIVVIGMAGAATVLLVLRGALGHRAPVVAADEGESVGFE